MKSRLSSHDRLTHAIRYLNHNFKTCLSICFTCTTKYMQIRTFTDAQIPSSSSAFISRDVFAHGKPSSANLAISICCYTRLDSPIHKTEISSRLESKMHRINMNKCCCQVLSSRNTFYSHNWI
jgi:hypothetical protein